MKKKNKMLIIKAKTDNILKNKSISYYKLSKLIGYSESYLNNIFSGKSPFPEKLINKILPILEITREELESWILADKYPKEVLKLAIQAKKDFPYKSKSIVTTKIDTLLQERNMSRTALAKKIRYSQSSLNKMITGKRRFSKSVLERTAGACEISQDELSGWIVADKYSLSLLESAYSQFSPA